MEDTEGHEVVDWYLFKKKILPEKNGGEKMALSGDQVTQSFPNGKLTDQQLDRYSRQILLSEIGVGGQAKLLQAKVVLVGAGGLGSPAALYLAAAGVGTIGLIDADTVDRSNLHRQILHHDYDLGRPKVRSGRHHIENLNPDIKVIEHQVRLSSANAKEIISEYDVIINGSDNFPTRYLVNDTCVLLGKPLVDASILKWEGQLNVFMPKEGCYRCLFPQPPLPGTVPSCAEAGIVGALAGMMGSMEAMEAIKIILGLDEVAKDRTFTINVLSGQSRSFKRKRRTDCPVCGDSPTVTELIDYELFCGLPSVQQTANPASVTSGPQPYDKSVNELINWWESGDTDTLWIDVRSPQEYLGGHIPGAELIPITEFENRINEIPKDKRVVFICKAGVRSIKAIEILRDAGEYPNIYNMTGGMLAWENSGYPVEGQLFEF